MRIRLGTFNCNNLFSRFNFKAQVLPLDRGGRRHSLPKAVELRTSMGKLIPPKPEAATCRLAERILAAAPDVLAVQEVEDKQTLADFNQRHLGGRFPERVLVEGNDPRFIDVALLSRYPIGEVRSYQRYRHPELPGEPVFRRDFLLAEILSPDRRRRLFWVGVAHLKSQLVDWRLEGDAAKRKAQSAASRLRRLEGESIRQLLRDELHHRERVFVCGDFNDVPDSPALAPLLRKKERGGGLVNLLARLERQEDRRWTITHKQTGAPREFDQFDYVLASPSAADRVHRAWVERRATRPTVPDGSDHDPVMCEVVV